MKSLRKLIEDEIYFPMFNSLQIGIIDNLGGGNKILGNIHIRISGGIRQPIINKIKLRVVKTIADSIFSELNRKIKRQKIIKKND